MLDERSATNRAAIVIPVKAFDKAKERLASTLNSDERSALARRMATRVVTAARSLSQFDNVIVVCDDQPTAQWAQALGATALVAPQPGLNTAVEHAYAVARATHDWIAVCHADIADPTGLATLARPRLGSITMIADRHGLGTNVLALNTTDDFTFHYGPTSFADHTAEAHRRQLSVMRLDDPGLALDLDTPDDVALFNNSQRNHVPDSEKH